jgi:hypothetical protein
MVGVKNKIAQNVGGVKKFAWYEFFLFHTTCEKKISVKKSDFLEITPCGVN